MQHLNNNCRVSAINVIPGNWASPKASTARNWRISYRFYDPRFPRAKQIAIAGMNRYKDLKDRQSVTKALIDQETALLQRGFNPFDNVVPDPLPVAIGPQMAFGDALNMAAEKIVAVKGTKIDIRSVIKGMSAAADRLNLDLPIGQIGRRHIKMMLENCREHNKRFSDKRFNKYKAYLSTLFRQLIEMELVESNPVRDIAKAKETQTLREELTPEDMQKIAALKETNFEFYRYVVIFFYSGSRTTELFRLKREDVNLPNQEFKVLVKKGRQYREDMRGISDEVVGLWTGLIQAAKPGEFLFSKNLRPGAKPIRPDQINRRWNKYVKTGLGVEKDFYALKHTYADQIAARLGIDHAATADGHTTPVITLKHYATGEKARQRERIKKAGIKFG
jgi:integrase